MSILYTIALCAVFICFIALTAEAVLSVARPKPWPLPDASDASLALVATTERRVNDLRYIGPERRAALRAAEEARAEAGRRAA